MQSDVSIAFCGTSLSWYQYYQPPLIARLQAATGKFIREFNYGVNGSNSNGTDGGLSRIGQTVADHPDFAFIEYSMNDCVSLSRAQAIANHYAMLDALKTVMPASRLFLMTMNPSTDPTRTTLADYYVDYRTLSAQQGVGLIDNEPVWQAYGAVASYTPDGVHPRQADTIAVTTQTLFSVLQPLVAAL